MSVVVDESGPDVTPGPVRGPNVGRSSCLCNDGGLGFWSSFWPAKFSRGRAVRKQTAKIHPPNLMATSPCPVQARLAVIAWPLLGVSVLHCSQCLLAVLQILPRVFLPLLQVPQLALHFVISARAIHARYLQSLPGVSPVLLLHLQGVPVQLLLCLQRLHLGVPVDRLGSSFGGQPDSQEN